VLSGIVNVPEEIASVYTESSLYIDGGQPLQVNGTFNSESE
jgi:hypothetical protein